MLVIKGRIVDFLIDRCNDGYAEFIFKSDYDKDCPRFETICGGKIPDVVPGVPMKIEIPVDDVSQVVKINFQEQRIDRVTRDVRQKYMNRVAYACINYNDEEYARTLLVKVKGISNKTANRILDAVDGDISQLAELWDDSEFWKGLRGAKKWLGELKNTVGSMMSKDRLVRKYGKYGIGYPQIDMLVAMYELEAEEKLCKNPYSVLHKLDLDFQVADNFAKDLGFDYLCMERVRAMIYQVLNDNESHGNTAMPKREFYIACAKMHRMSAWKDYVISPYYILSTLSSMDRVYCEDNLVGYLDTLNKESDIAFQLSRLLKADTSLGTADVTFEKIKDKYNKEQLDFLRTFDKNSVTVLLGRGGTGKTHTICGAIELFKQKYPDEEVRLCAPTARAAGVLKEHSGHESSTIHIMLELNPYMPDEAGKNEETPLDAKLIVVDEMSMVDTNLMYYLLRAVKSGAKLILSGDPDQLESVGCGAVLRDLINSNVIPKVKLKKIMRQNEGSAVIDNCGKILMGKYDFIENESFKIRVCNSEEEAKAYLKAYYCGDIHSTQILSTTKKGVVGTMSLNREFENPDDTGVWIHGDYFKQGDKVVFTKNNYETGYCNGDIGFIETVQMPLRIKKQGEEKVIEINRDDAVDMEHADAITIHKSQGSEYDKVYILLPESPASLLTRNMVNTAISRARKEVILIIINDALKTAASNKYKRNRVTRLQNRLQNLEDSQWQEEEKKERK